MTNNNIPNDPDFDGDTGGGRREIEKRGLLHNLDSQTAFYAGIITAVLGICVVGFFVLLGIIVKNGGLGSRSTVSESKVTAREVTRQAPAPLQDPEAGGVINIREITKDDHIRGDKNSKITLVEFSDLECPFCKKFHPTMQRVLKEYDGKVRWVYRHFPLRSLHSKAAKEAEATECAAEQGKFWEYADKLFEVTPSNDGLEPTQLPLIAEQVGLNRKKFEECLNGGKYATHVSEDEQDAASSGARGTPHSVILTSDGKKIPVSGAVPFEQLKSIIDSLL